MGNHFVPQAYIHSWANDGPYVVAYPTSKGASPINSNKKNIGHETRLYTDELEKRLNIFVEEPMLPIIRAINRGERIPPDSKAIIARYFHSLIQRSPWAAQLVRTHLSSLLDKAQAEGFSAIEQNNHLTTEQKESLRSALAEQLAQAKSKGAKTWWQEALDPDRTSLGEKELASMNMALLTAPTHMHFLTSDRPVMRPFAGFADGEDVFLLPIGPRKLIALSHCELVDMTLSPQIVRDINMRVVVEADKWVIASIADEWIRPFIDKYRARGVKSLDRLVNSESD